MRKDESWQLFCETQLSKNEPMSQKWQILRQMDKIQFWNMLIKILLLQQLDELRKST